MVYFVDIQMRKIGIAFHTAVQEILGKFQTDLFFNRGCFTQSEVHCWLDWWWNNRSKKCKNFQHRVHCTTEKIESLGGSERPDAWHVILGVEDIEVNESMMNQSLGSWFRYQTEQLQALNWLVGIKKPSGFLLENWWKYFEHFQGGHDLGLNPLVALRPKRVCYPRHRGNIQREAQKRGRRENFGHWGSWSFV